MRGRRLCLRTSSGKRHVNFIVAHWVHNNILWNNKDPGQPAHVHSLIWVFAVHVNV